MDFTDRLALKRKYPDGEMDALYLNHPYNNFKRPSYELESKPQIDNININPGLLSHGDGYHLSVGQNDTNPLTFSTKDDMFMEDARTNIDANTKSMNSLISTCHSNATIRQPNAIEPSLVTESSSIQKSLVKSQGCTECLAGKSGHIHHIGRWKLIDSPSGFCQL